MRIKVTPRAPIVLAIALFACIFSSCDDEKDSWNSVDVKNAELKAVLQQKGFTFDTEGKLIQDDKVKNTTTLDLSGCNLTDVSGLNVFPNLAEINLSDNKIYKTFDFGVLPTTVNSVDLTGNEIYEYLGLVNVVTQENGDETVTLLRELKKLYLPEGAKYNCDQIVYFYTENRTAVDDGTIDMKLSNASGSLEKYTTLREVPDAQVRSYLSENFPSLFSSDKIDISKRLVKAAEKTRGIIIHEYTYPGVTDLEGVEYIAMNKGFEGGTIELVTKPINKIQYLKVKPCVASLTLVSIETPCLDLSQATRLYHLEFTRNPYLEELDLTTNTVVGQRSLSFEFMESSSDITVGECENFKRIKFPSQAKLFYSIALYNLPKLEKIDLSQFEAMSWLGIGNVNCRITYPDIRYFVFAGEKNDENGKLKFGITEAVYNLQETKVFLDKYHKNMTRSNILVPLGLRPSDLKGYNWTIHYQ